MDGAGSGCRVLILGHGEMGTALEGLLRGRHQVSIWERDLSTGRETVPLEAAVRGVDCALFALPAAPHRELARRVREASAGTVPILSIAKGLDEAGATPAETLALALGDTSPFGLIYGPMIAEELHAGRRGFAMLATRDQGVVRLGRRLFEGSALQLRTTDDVVGASWCAVLKNVYVPLLGVADGLGLGDNVRGALVVDVLAELERIVLMLGGRAETVRTLAGLGDLVTTATSAGSHHHRIGMDIARGRTGAMQDSGPNVRGEGIHALRVLSRSPRFDTSGLALFNLMRGILAAPSTARAAMDEYLDDAL